MEFEFDPNKSSTNAEKHGIDFVAAQRLWDDEGLIILPSKNSNEQRYLAIGRIDDRHWTAIFSERGVKTRIISVRRARGEEEDLYERNQ